MTLSARRAVPLATARGVLPLPMYPPPPRADTGVSATAFRAAAGRFGTGVTVLTALRGEQGRGMTANSFASVSLEPLMVLVCIRRDSEMRELVADLGHYAVSVLGQHQQEVARYFASSQRPQGAVQFDSVDWRPAPASGAPVVDGALAWFDCVVASMLDAGDHTVVVGEVVHLGHHAGDPLLFVDGQYRALDAGWLDHAQLPTPGPAVLRRRRAPVDVVSKPLPRGSFG